MPPMMLIQSLESIRRRVKMLSVAFGVGIVVAAAVGALLAVILLDYILNLPAGPRVAILLCAVVGLAYVLWRWVLSPMTTRLSVRDVAGWLAVVFLAGEAVLFDVVAHRAEGDAQRFGGAGQVPVRVF